MGPVMESNASDRVIVHPKELGFGELLAS